MKSQLNILCLQHVSFEGPGIIQDWALEHNHNFKIVHLYKNELLPKSDEVDMLIIMGGPMSFDEEEKYSWMTGEIDFIKEIIKQDKAVLGICLGAQFIVKAMGGKALHGNAKEIGWFPVKFDSEVLNRLGWHDFPEYQPVFHWHGDTFEIPQEAEHWASTNVFSNQAFTYKNKVVGIQFHFEVKEDSVLGMLENCGDEIVESPNIQSVEDIRSNLGYIPASNTLMKNILNYLEK